jgi:hypothetical protein
MLAAEPLSWNPSQSSPPPPGCSAVVEPSPLEPIWARPSPSEPGHPDQRPTPAELLQPGLAVVERHRRQNHPARRTRASRGAPPLERKRAPTRPLKRGERRSAGGGDGGRARRRGRPPEVGGFGPVALGRARGAGAVGEGTRISTPPRPVSDQHSYALIRLHATYGVLLRRTHAGSYICAVQGIFSNSHTVVGSCTSLGLSVSELLHG